MVEAAGDEDGAVGELGELNGKERDGVAVMAYGAVEREERVDERGNVFARGEKVGRCDFSGGGVDELGSLVVTVDVDVQGGDFVAGKVLLSGEAAGERIEVLEGDGEGGFEIREEDGEGKRSWEVGKKETFLDVMRAEHGDVPWCEVAQAGMGGVLGRLYCVLGKDFDHGRRRRHD